MYVERAGAVLLDGTPLTLLGPEIRTGDKAPDFSALANDFSAVSLNSAKDKIRILLSLPSLDTDVCDAEARRFNKEAEKWGKNVIVYGISVDLPFALTRWCSKVDFNSIRTLSDHRSLSFANAYGTHIKESRTLSRAVFVIDRKNIVRYVEYVAEIGHHPNYDAAIATVNKLL